MNGPAILARTLSSTNIRDRYQNDWQYHSRSDHHSKIACWGVIFDLMVSTPLLRRHVRSGAVCFGINHEMRDFVHDRKKNLDLVLCTPGGATTAETLASMGRSYRIELTDEERSAFDELPQVAFALNPHLRNTKKDRFSHARHETSDENQATIDLAFGGGTPGPTRSVKHGASCSVETDDAMVGTNATSKVGKAI
jgi:hypothetical protein